MQEAIVNVNGLITPGANAQISIFDRGFLYGDSLYEVFRTQKGKVFQCEEHLERLEHSARLCRMELHQSNELIALELKKTIQAYHEHFHNPHQELYLRLIISRGKGKIGFGLKSIETQTQFFIIAMPLPEWNEAGFKKGMNLFVSSYYRNHPKALNPAMKSGNYLNNVLAFLEAEENGCDDALLLDQNGNVTEGTTFNLFMVKNQTLITPPLEIGILHGITRRDALQLAQLNGIQTIEKNFTLQELLSADEVFASGTVRCIFPVTTIHGQKIKTGVPGPITLKLYQEYRSWSAHL